MVDWAVEWMYGRIGALRKGRMEVGWMDGWMDWMVPNIPR